MQWMPYITIQKTVKYLGFTIDNKLDFYQHIKAIEKKVACAIGILCKLKYYLPKDVPIGTLSCSHIFSLDLCNSSLERFI